MENKETDCNKCSIRDKCKSIDRDLINFCVNFMKKESNATKKQVSGTHYKNMKIQPIEYCMANKMNYCESFAIKYISRHRNKNGLDDLKKAIHMIELLIDQEYRENS